MDHIYDPNRAARLHKLWNSAISDGRTWSKFGERGEHEKDEKHQPDDLKHSINDSKHSVCDSKHARLKNIILGQLKMGEHQAATCGATPWCCQ